MKINLSKPILTIKGVPVTTPELDDSGKPIIEKGKEKKRNMEVRDYFLTILGQRFEIKNKKENFWTTELGILCADSKNKEIELSEEKTQFLKRIVENNKIKQQTPMGIKEIELFFPYELGQLLKVLEGEE